MEAFEVLTNYLIFETFKNYNLIGENATILNVTQLKVSEQN